MSKHNYKGSNWPYCVFDTDAFDTVAIVLELFVVWVNSGRGLHFSGRWVISVIRQQKVELLREALVIFDAWLAKSSHKKFHIF